jgi:hypothetical protein
MDDVMKIAPMTTAQKDAMIRAYARRLAPIHDCSVARAEQALRNLLAKGLIEVVPLAQAA